MRSEEPLSEDVRVGDLAGIEDRVIYAERSALSGDGYGELRSGELSVASVALESIHPGGRPRGLVTVGRNGRPFSNDDCDLLRSLAAQATLARENVELHLQVIRQAVPDELTGFANLGRFQDLLSAEMEQVRRYHHPVGLITLDIDDSKSVHDTFGHQQGDVVLTHVARVLESTREADTAGPLRRGGDDPRVAPHRSRWPLRIAEHIRSAIAGLRIPRLDQKGVLRVTVSLAFALWLPLMATRTLITDADAALYTAKRDGRNRTVQSAPHIANVFGGE